MINTYEQYIMLINKFLIVKYNELYSHIHRHYTQKYQLPFHNQDICQLCNGSAITFEKTVNGYIPHASNAVLSNILDLERMLLKAKKWHVCVFAIVIVQ